MSYLLLTPEGSLTIMGTQDVDDGAYECIATNEAGSARGTVMLEVGCE